MMRVEPLTLDGHIVLGIEVKLPKTTLLVITTAKGYIMCGALDVKLLNDLLSDRHIVAGRALGVRTLDDLLNAKLESVTYEAEKLGIQPGTRGKDALLKMI